MTRHPAIRRAGDAVVSVLQKHQNVLALLAIAAYCWPPLSEIRRFWDDDVAAATNDMLAAHLYFFDATLMILVAAVLTRNLTPPVFAASFVLAGTAGVQWLIDVQLHDILAETGVFLWIFGAKSSDQIVNPRSAKLLLFALLLPLLVTQLFIRRTRSVDRAFALMGTLAVIVTTYLFHTALPDGTMRTAKQQAEFVTRYAATAEPEQAAAFCAHLRTRCVTVRGRDALQAELHSAGLHELANLASSLPVGAVVSTGTGAVVRDKHGREHLQPMLAAFKVPKEDELVTVLIEVDQAEWIETVHERSFALLAIAAHAFWTLFIAALCALHQWRGRSRFFRPAQGA